MSTVAQQISNLLFTHECVIIPNLGAFVSTIVSAQFDSDKSLFLPPSKEIGFNRSLSHNDGLLISTLSQKNDISYGKAKILVEEFVADVMNRVKRGEKVLIDKVGSLKQDALGYLQFTPDCSEAYLTDAFGLSSFQFSPIMKAKPVLVENREVRRLLRPVGLKQIAASVAIVIGLFAISQKVDNPTMNKQMSNASALSFVSVINHEEDATETLVLTTDEMANSSLEVEVPTITDCYFLIAGSFKKESQAERFLSQVRAKGEAKAFVLKSPNHRFRVAIEGFADKNNAIAQLDIYRQKEDFKTVWILTQQ